MLIRDDLRTEKVDHSLQGRWRDSREVAFPMLWLASDEASFVTPPADLDRYHSPWPSDQPEPHFFFDQGDIP